ncbi:hypothetical protein H0H81_003467 [Sphagnurus paluster]|uniref:Uncharacterized protein n=1 Tax=Sphagnurus paluster TaxID=117069 RepID=A0A9P7FPY0_9AGAR|nr:hypothetical protein H0H81_003467 [Sphagnurus paluster]
MILIATKIYRAAATCSRNRSRNMSLVWLFIESGAIYTTAAIIQLGLSLAKLNAGQILEMILAQLSAIAPALIVIRIGLGVAFNGKNETIQEDVVFTTMHDTTISIVSLNQPVGTEPRGHAIEKGEN